MNKLLPTKNTKRVVIEQVMFMQKVVKVYSSVAY